ncbi:uncharacterized protein TNCV_4746711 [Trichonephila clavipes]|nr:uncharacterized protein TNCV_4746711 [Trichonephila clavipes]
MENIPITQYRSLCAAEEFHSDASLEAVDQQAPNTSKHWQWTAEVDVSARRSTPALHGKERPYNFLQAVGSTLVYCYRRQLRQFVDVCCTVDWVARVNLYRIPLTSLVYLEAGIIRAILKCG